MILTFIISMFVTLILKTISLILIPLDLLIINTVPNLDVALSSVSNYFSMVTNSLGYVVSLTLLSSTALSLIVTYYSFALVFPLAVHSFKFVYKWYAKLH